MPISWIKQLHILGIHNYIKHKRRKEYNKLHPVNKPCFFLHLLCFTYVMQFENVCLFCHGCFIPMQWRFYFSFLLFSRQYFINSATSKGILWQYAGWQERICSLCRLFFSFCFLFFFLSKVHNLDTKLNFICALLSPFQLCKQGCWYDNV